ncbi:Uncharacterised protein [Mycobacterium tuberculosis]|uniref:Uncharacterized protein n=1 Tax=Mycobacterium tuberculosis TaxID=1773 RepID=A0A655FWU1_MYCTX|nr:Uncharacterised protein [Mycobacterium tuberculosis]CKT54489.1 Uncharacterised protein [Mycobacterium tuberculosis]CKT65581.1 Uncharacterised protein [Mycobacterium tuberculosis]CKV16614.1 Uncharacterised protein [Mycobacterium tuberculosis]CNV65790.1 Uncharacterised protein [Mycobacterium tuberculosis]
MESSQQGGQCRLAGAGRADERGDRARPQRKRYILDHRHSRAVPEGDVVEHHSCWRLAVERFARMFPHGEFGFVECDLQVPGRQKSRA